MQGLGLLLCARWVFQPANPEWELEEIFWGQCPAEALVLAHIPLSSFCQLPQALGES